jgi:hypothetical protein
MKSRGKSNFNFAIFYHFSQSKIQASFCPLRLLPKLCSDFLFLWHHFWNKRSCIELKETTLKPAISLSNSSSLSLSLSLSLSHTHTHTHTHTPHIQYVDDASSPISIPLKIHGYFRERCSPHTRIQCCHLPTKFVLYDAECQMWRHDMQWVEPFLTLCVKTWLPNRRATMFPAQRLRIGVRIYWSATRLPWFQHSGCKLTDKFRNRRQTNVADLLSLNVLFNEASSVKMIYCLWQMKVIKRTARWNDRNTELLE